jgi:hypothetical protein
MTTFIRWLMVGINNIFTICADAYWRFKRCGLPRRHATPQAFQNRLEFHQCIIGDTVTKQGDVSSVTRLVMLADVLRTLQSGYRQHPHSRKHIYQGDLVEATGAALMHVLRFVPAGRYQATSLRGRNEGHALW